MRTPSLCWMNGCSRYSKGSWVLCHQTKRSRFSGVVGKHEPGGRVGDELLEHALQGLRGEQPIHVIAQEQAGPGARREEPAHVARAFLALRRIGPEPVLESREGPG